MNWIMASVDTSYDMRTVTRIRVSLTTLEQFLRKKMLCLRIEAARGLPHASTGNALIFSCHSRARLVHVVPRGVHATVTGISSPELVDRSIRGPRMPPPEMSGWPWTRDTRPADRHEIRRPVLPDGLEPRRPRSDLPIIAMSPCSRASSP